MSILKRLREEQKTQRKSSDKDAIRKQLREERKAQRKLSDDDRKAPTDLIKSKRKPQGTYKRGRGRSPSASPAYVRSKRVTIALSLPEFEALHTAAAGHGVAASTFVRKALFGEVKAVRPHPERPKSEAQAALLANEPQKLDGRTRAGKAANRRKSKTKK